MKHFPVIRDNTPPDEIIKGSVVALGNFDGVHLGHRAVIAAAVDMAHKKGRPALAVTFEPHPRTFFSPNTPQFKLTDLRDKLRLLAATGLDGAVVMTFDAARARTTAQDFINHDLMERLGITGISVGFDFHFGKGRAGSPALLAAEGPKLGIEVHVQAMSMRTAAPYRRPPSAMLSVRATSPRPPTCSAIRGSSLAK